MKVTERRYECLLKHPFLKEAVESALSSPSKITEGMEVQKRPFMGFITKMYETLDSDTPVGTEMRDSPLKALELIDGFFSIRATLTDTALEDFEDTYAVCMSDLVNTVITVHEWTLQINLLPSQSQFDDLQANLLKDLEVTLSINKFSITLMEEPDNRNLILSKATSNNEEIKTLSRNWQIKKLLDYYKYHLEKLSLVQEPKSEMPALNSIFTSNEKQEEEKFNTMQQDLDEDECELMGMLENADYGSNPLQEDSYLDTKQIVTEVEEEDAPMEDDEEIEDVLDDDLTQRQQVSTYVDEYNQALIDEENISKPTTPEESKEEKPAKKREVKSERKMKIRSFKLV